jgi:tetratricopeptide (TPR) repeat protein
MGSESVRSVFPAAAGWTRLALGLIALTAGCARFDSRMELKKGNASYKEGKFAKSIDFYDKVQEGIPERVMAALNTGYANMAQYRFGSSHEKDKELALKAVEAYDEYIKIRPADADDKHYPPTDKVDEYIVTLLADSGRFDQAVTRLEDQLKRKLNDPAILRAIAQTYDKWGKPTMALEYFQRWARLFPKDASPEAAIAAYCWNMSYRQGSTMDPLDRNRWVDFGVVAADAALAIDPNQVEAVTYKNLILRERAKLRVSPDEVASLMKDANVLLEKAKELRKKQKEEEAAKANASPSPKGGPS